MSNNYSVSSSNTSYFPHFIVRFIVAAIVLGITAFFTPGFTIAGIWPLLIGAAVIAIMDFLILKVSGINASAFGRGFSGFILSAIIIYLTQFFVAGYSVSFWGALIGAIIYGIVDAIIPGKATL